MQRETKMEMETAEIDPLAMSHWKSVVVLMQTDFQEGRLEQESSWQVVVIITKGRRDYYGIGLVQVVWNVVTIILNLCLTTSIDFHDVLHGFWLGRVTRTTSLEAKLLQQLLARRQEVLYVILINLHKAYEALDRDICLEIMEGYGVVPLAHHTLHHYWYSFERGTNNPDVRYP